MENCYSCGDPFDGTNNSQEHIINNSIGGRWKSRGLLCTGCNKTFGGTIDQALKDQLGNFTDLLGIVRQREKNTIAVPMKGSDGEIKFVGKRLKPHSRVTTTLPDGKKIVEYVPDDEFEEFIARKKEQVSKKYKIKEEKYYVEKPVNDVFKIQNSLSGDEFDIGFGGEEFFRSVTKMAVNYYLKLGYDIEWVKSAIAMIRGEIKNEIAYFYYPKAIHYQIHDLAEGEVSHIIHIRGDRERKLLYAYVELFSMQNVLIKLNPNYKGPDVNVTYAVDLFTGKEIDKVITIKLGKHHFEILHLIAGENMQEKISKYRRIELIIERTQMDQ